MTAAVEALSSICKALAEELDRSLSFALTQKPTSRLRRSERKVASSKKRKEDSAISAQTTKKFSKPKRQSPYFPSTPTKRAPISCILFPPTTSTSFGLCQERLSSIPFHLLLACIFLNKTRGSVALPVFYSLLKRYPTPSDLAAAKHADVVNIIQHLGLQNQRANTCINLAKAWVEREPVKGRRRRVLHYPRKGDGKNLRIDEVIDDEDERVAWEVGQLPGVGVYAIDSWRIFCRDELRGLPSGLPDQVTEDSIREEMQKEWTRVLPLDKELRAYLRWRWLRNGFVWDPVTGEKRAASEEEMETARKGGVIIEGENAGIVIAEAEKGR